MEARQLHTIQIRFRDHEHRYVIVWPFEPNSDRHCCKLINSKRTWLTCRAGDAVLLRKEKSTEWERFFVESVTLFRVFPVEFNGKEVETAQGWLDGSD